ncbi:MAG: hypothetical protein H0X08_01875 [Blastocatellia bacterium]|nr:hypothetical protein [Blastocatellia bacterium]
MLGLYVFVALSFACTTGSVCAQNTQTGTPHTVQNMEFVLPDTWEFIKGSGTKTFRSEEFSQKGSTVDLIADVERRKADGVNNSDCVREITSFAGGSWNRWTENGSAIARHSESDKNGNIRRVSYIGCSKQATWSLVFFSSEPGTALVRQTRSVVKTIRNE